MSMAWCHAYMAEERTKKGFTMNPPWRDSRLPTVHNMAAAEDADVSTGQYCVGKPYRTKEVGEGLVSGILAAIANAIYDATGVRMHSTPFTPDKILKGLKMQAQAGRPISESARANDAKVHDDCLASEQ